MSCFLNYYIFHLYILDSSFQQWAAVGPTLHICQNLSYMKFIPDSFVLVLSIFITIVIEIKSHLEGRLNHLRVPNYSLMCMNLWTKSLKCQSSCYNNYVELTISLFRYFIVVAHSKVILN